MSVTAQLHEFINIIREIDITFFWAQVGVRGWLAVTVSLAVSLADLQSKAKVWVRG